ncbi:hypothetical protein BLNAU_15853 [Blattamonas nauphoetae]|uniref:Uncharacterized protein n=1 Tax=Blattamonas nauphoetae TaxID=2049346 RepID=A0ABQ9XD34_9EUKA|nr:hypothetical protein BLNAU_15853 [Blattamonas nauphoetae]
MLSFDRFEMSIAMISSDKYSPFLTWNVNDPLTVDSVSAVFVSLVSMVRDDYNFDEELLKQASTFFSSIIRRATPGSFFESFLKTMREDPTDSIPTLLDSTIILLLSSHHSIIRDTLSFIAKVLDWSSLSNRLALVSSKLISRILSTPHLRDLSVIDNKDILNKILEILGKSLQLSFAGPCTPISADGRKMERKLGAEGE